MAIETFDVLIIRVHDIYANRILNVLLAMQEITLLALPPEDDLWTVEEFVEHSEQTCRSAAIELNRKSSMIAEAVEEVLLLVNNALQECKAMFGPEETANSAGAGSAKTSKSTSPEAGQKAASVDGENGGDGSAASPSQPQDWSILWSCFENPLSLLASSSGLPKGMQDMVNNAVSEMRRYYSRKVIDVLIKVTRASLDTLRKMFFGDATGDAATTSSSVTLGIGAAGIGVSGNQQSAVATVSTNRAIFLLHSTLMIPNVSINPSLEELQEVLIAVGRKITGVSKGVAQWSSGSKEVSIAPLAPTRAQTRHNANTEKSRLRKMYCLQSEERPQVPHMTKSFFSFIMDNKEIVKTLNLLSSCTKHVKPEFQAFIKRWKPYHYLWKNERSARELLEFGLVEFETALHYLADLDAQLLLEPDQQQLSMCLRLSTERLKFGLTIEIKACKHKMSQAMAKKYKREMDYVYAVINEMDRKLDRTIRDLDDVRMVMDTLAKIREQDVDMELKIDPIEEAFNILTKYDAQIEREVLDQVDNLRYTFQNLQDRALQAQVQLLGKCFVAIFIYRYDTALFCVSHTQHHGEHNACRRHATHFRIGTAQKSGQF